MKRKFSLRVQLLGILMVFVLAIVGLIYFVQTTFLDDFYMRYKVSSLKSVAQDIGDLVGEDDTEEIFDHLGMNNEVCIRLVSNDENYCYSGACTLRNLDHNTINLIASETVESGGEKLFDNFRYQHRFNDRPEDVYIYAKMINYDQKDILILVSSGITPLNTTIATLKSQYLLIVGIILLMTLILALSISRFILRPIKQINEESRNLSKGAYDSTLVKTNSREFAELNSTLENANQDILKADKAKKELLGNVSHDLRTPLTMIVGYGEMIRDLPEENNEENINVIIDEAKRLSVLVDDLVDISKMEDSAVELNREDVSLNELLESVYHQYEKYCEGKNIDLQLKTEEDITVNVDAKRIRQVLYNFLNNSLNYNSKDSQKIIIGTEKNGDFHRVYVYDNGDGIRKEDLQNVWDRYYKVDKEHRRHQIGSGIGLSLSRELLKAHGLNYGVESEEGEYSKFYFDVEDVTRKSGK